MAYITEQRLRAEGVKEPVYSKEHCEQRIALAQDLIEQLTGRFFEERAGQLYKLHGTGHDLIELPHAPTNLTSVTIDGDTAALDSSLYEIVKYSGSDWRRMPMLRYLEGCRWPKGTYNIKVEGDFGFVDDLGGDPPSYSTPALIQDLCARIATLWLPRIGDAEGQKAREIVEESLKDYRYRLSEKSLGGGFFNDRVIDSTIAMFRKPRVGAV